MKPPRPKKYWESLEYQLCEQLGPSVGERGHNEGAVEVLIRIKNERDAAFTILALDRLAQHRERAQNWYATTPLPPLPKRRRKRRR